MTFQDHIKYTEDLIELAKLDIELCREKIRLAKVDIVLLKMTRIEKKQLLKRLEKPAKAKILKRKSKNP